MSYLTIITPDGFTTRQHYDLEEHPNLDALRRVLNPIFHAQRAGSSFEHVAVLSDKGKPVDMFVDDESAGLFPPNVIATRVYHRASIERGEKNISGVIPDAPMIYGTAVLFDRRVWF
jgi:hypothetical protein